MKGIDMKFKYPTKVVVRNEEYQVKVVKKLTGKDVGECDPDKHEIRIRMDQSSHQILSTFIHEILHAMEFEYDLKISHKLVYQLEHAFVDFILQNPEVFK